MLGADSTTDDVLAGVDLTGRTAVITGSSGGLGLETARALAARGAAVVLAARDRVKLDAAVAQLRDQVPGITVDSVVLDLAALTSVRAAAAEVADRHPVIDLLIDNAGVMACPLGRTTDGFETQFGTNHLGHFVLVNRIAGLMKPGSRLVNLSSVGHRYADVDLDDPTFEHTPYEQMIAYGRSKTANILFAVEFDRRHKAEGIRATAVHPGAIQTELSRHMTPEYLQSLVAHIEANTPAGTPAYVFKTVQQGAATSLWAGVTAPAELVGGKYCEDCHVAELVSGSELRTGVRAYALDPDRARALWAKSEEMVGEHFA